MTLVDEMTLDAEMLKRLRARAQLSQQDLAVTSGLSIAQIMAMEQGKRNNPRLDTLRKLAAALKCTVGELVGDASPVPPQPPQHDRKPRGK